MHLSIIYARFGVAHVSTTTIEPFVIAPNQIHVRYFPNAIMLYLLCSDFTPFWEFMISPIHYIYLSHDQTLSANQRSLNVRYISCNHALAS